MRKSQARSKEFFTKTLTSIARIRLISSQLTGTFPSGPDFRSLGNTGIMVTPFCFGAFRTNEESLIKYAFEKGMNFIDTGRAHRNGKNEQMARRAVAGRKGSVVILSKMGSEENKLPSKGKGRRGALRKLILLFFTVIIHLFVSFFCKTQAQDSPQWGELHSRNMVSNVVGLPKTFNPETGKNIKWSVSLGSDSYATPVISGGKVLIGTNNVGVRDPRHEGDRGVLLCLNESDGSLCWQLVVPRIVGDRHNDWPMIGICSSPTVEGNRVYVLTNRSEVLCLDLNGQADGNDGTFQGENWYMAPTGEFSYEVTLKDADIIWSYDMRLELGMCPHDVPHASILLDGNNLYLNTGNGVDKNHLETSCPNAPSLIALDKNTGRLVAKDNENFGPRIFHCGWSSPSLGEVNGQKLLFFGGPDGILYAFKALSEAIQPEQVQLLEKVWQFDPDQNAPKENIHEYLRNLKEGPSGFLGMPVFHKNRIYVTVGGDIWWGKRQAWLKCIDASKTGDITKTGEIWSQALEIGSAATPAISNGLVYVTDCGKNLHCIDAESGYYIWTHKLIREAWTSALVADNKVYVGSGGRDFWILDEGKEKNVLDSVVLDSPINSTPAAANGVLYVSTMNRLYAIKQKE